MPPNAAAFHAPVSRTAGTTYFQHRFIQSNAKASITYVQLAKSIAESFATATWRPALRACNPLSTAATSNRAVHE
jgi:hypothetical protein